MHRRLLYSAIVILILGAISVVGGYAWVTETVTNENHLSATRTTAQYPNSNSTELVIEAVTLTEPNPTSTALFTLFVANLGNSSLGSLAAFLALSQSNNATVSFDQTNLGPHDIASGQVKLSSSCVVGESYVFTIQWITNDFSHSKSSLASCELA